VSPVRARSAGVSPAVFSKTKTRAWARPVRGRTPRPRHSWARCPRHSWARPVRGRTPRPRHSWARPMRAGCPRHIFGGLLGVLCVLHPQANDAHTGRPIRAGLGVERDKSGTKPGKRRCISHGKSCCAQSAFLVKYVSPGTDAGIGHRRSRKCQRSVRRFWSSRRLFPLP